MVLTDPFWIEQETKYGRDDVSRRMAWDCSCPSGDCPEWEARAGLTVEDCPVHGIDGTGEDE